MKYINSIMTFITGAILAINNINVFNSWLAWVIIAIVAINGAGWTFKR